MPNMTYMVTLNGWGHHSVLKIVAESEAEAIRKAQAERGISVTVQKIEEDG